MSGEADLGGSLRIAFDANHLFLGGVITDDHFSGEPGLYDRGDRIELYLGFGIEAGAASMLREDTALYLKPLQTRRPWSWANSQDSGRGSVSQLAGIEVMGRRVDDQSYQFEAAIPFHHFPSLQPGMRTIGFGLLLRDADPDDGGRATVLSWNGRDPTGNKGLGLLRLPEPGALGSAAPGGPLLSNELLADLPYLLVPLVTLLGLLFLGRGWPRLRSRARWLRPLLIVGGVACFLLGLMLPSLRISARGDAQRATLTAAMDRIESSFARFDPGTLTSYRGASRDRAVMDLLAGKSVARQKFTSYRPLAQIAPTSFGPPPREFDGLPVRPYWIPVGAERPESFQFDPPLHGARVHMVLSRPFTPTFTFPARPQGAPRLGVELDFGGDNKRTQSIELDRPFADGSSLGREFWEACVVPINLDRDLRALTVQVHGGADLRLVGISLEGAQPGQVTPLLLGAPSRDGVLTDLRGPYPRDAGVELASGATTKVAVPPGTESPQSLWFFYQAFYPGLPVAHPGAHVAEIVLHFAGGKQKRSIPLEHQVSMFYELAVHNTRDDPPEGSPASIALSWVDEAQERHVNLGYQVTGLPPDAELEAIEFRNVAEYRMRFRSVVFVNERVAAPQDASDSPLVGEGPERWLPAAWLSSLAGVNVSLYRGGRLSESTLPADQRQDMSSLPRTGSGSERTTIEALVPGGGRRVALYAPLRGEYWDGAVVAVSSTDENWTVAGQDASRSGFLLCLLGTPILLVLISELLTVVANLRFRLMAVMSLASLAPLGVLSLVLVQVLEGGHAADVEANMRAAVQSTLAQMDSQKAKVQKSAQQWLRDLAALAESKLKGVGEPQLREAVPVVGAELQKLLAGQLPPEWRGGFLRLEWQPNLGKTTAATQVLVSGDERMANVETPARLDPGLFMQWGALLLGVRAETAVRGGTLALTAARPLDGNLLGALAPGHDLLLTDVRGYPIAASAERSETTLLLHDAEHPRTMGRRERALAAGIEQRRPIVEHASTAFGDFVFGSEVLRDLQDTPRGLLLVAAPDQRATLDLAIGRIPVRAFFLLVAGSLVVLSAFLSFVVSGRISRPIERLEHGAQALSRGVLETRVTIDEGGQIGRLTRTFNQMAADLQGRLLDLQALNRAMGELAAEQDEGATIDVLRRFCQSHTAADSLRIALGDLAGQQIELHPGGAGVGVPSLDLSPVRGAFSCSGRRGALPSPWREALPGCRSLLALPITFGGRVRGLLLLGFERPEPMVVDLELLSTVVAQAASAFERSQLQRLAVQDPVTGTFTLDYFRRRVVDEVSLAQ
ncbi:MAG: HAMP domain-containing protein, partial [Planctomycetes bacterium]|nr:HAMP domain-containing protein [Planctomycetota bacterium]